MSYLVIVESPGKTGAIKGYLGAGYKVAASVGHVRDLPKSVLGVDMDKGFTANYITIRSKTQLIDQLKKEAKAAKLVYLATDPDREGEAISWHLLSVLDCPEEKIRRVTFNEITKSAVTAGIANPRGIDMDLVNSQQTRRILDRIVGYKISPFLWHTVRGGLSAGRVQSVAARVIVDREEEIRGFKPEEYWRITAKLETPKGKSFNAAFVGIGGKKTEITSAKEAEAVYNGSVGEAFTVKSIKKSTKSKTPPPPFTTSTLLQDASRKLNFRSSRTMKTAQELYEGVDLGKERGGTQGLITYMRTDSLRISKEAMENVRAFIKSEYGDAYLPAKERYFKTRQGAQDAHEAIRPSSMSAVPDQIKDRLTPDQYRLYKLIFERFVASQMEAAVYDTVSVDIKAGIYDYHAAGNTLKFKGYLSVYEEGEDKKAEKEPKLPELNEGDVLKLLDLLREQKFTEPPPRYTEAMLIKFLEEQGIGRPSTIPPTITTIIDREYVKREGKTLMPTSLGEVIVGLMKEYFPAIIDYKFTADMEQKLDSIAHGEHTYESVLSDFWADFEKVLKSAEKRAGGKKVAVEPEKTDIVCDKCGALMVIKTGRFGKFAACPNYPACKNTMKVSKDGKVIGAAKEEPEKTDMKCELCGGAMVIRTGRYGKFYSCENFPKCKNSKPSEEEKTFVCPDCGGTVRHRRTKKSAFWSCSNYPECKFITSHEPTDEKCEICGSVKFMKKNGQTVCLKKDCKAVEK